MYCAAIVSFSDQVPNALQSMVAKGEWGWDKGRAGESARWEDSWQSHLETLSGTEEKVLDSQE